jgi:hypothetical protein
MTDRIFYYDHIIYLPVTLKNFHNQEIKINVLKTQNTVQYLFYYQQGKGSFYKKLS